MIPQITIGAASLMGSLIVATAAVRWAVRPVPARRAYGAAAPQDFAYCAQCRAEVPVIVHGDLLVCDNGHQIGGWA